MERFDELSKMLAASVSRRESLRAIGVALAGAALSTLGMNTAWAARPDRCIAFCRSCPTRNKRNQCIEACRACNGNTSRLCGSCGTYACCATGMACCSGVCTDLSSDANNCGACGYVCAASAPYCNQGTCSGCPGGTTNCGGACVSTSDDNANCGACGNRCASGTACMDGVCCNPGDLYSACYCGPDHPSYPNCCGGRFTFCGGVCTSTDTDNANCGTCGNVCPFPETCVAGVCSGPSCPAGQTFCNGACHNLNNENNFCGTTCENAVSCPFGTTCTGGVCVEF